MEGGVGRESTMHYKKTFVPSSFLKITAVIRAEKISINFCGKLCFWKVI